MTLSSAAAWWAVCLTVFVEYFDHNPWRWGGVIVSMVAVVAFRGPRAPYDFSALVCRIARISSRITRSVAASSVIVWPAASRSSRM